MCERVLGSGDIADIILFGKSTYIFVIKSSNDDLNKDTTASDTLLLSDIISALLLLISASYLTKYSDASVPILRVYMRDLSTYFLWHLTITKDLKDFHQ